MPKFGAKSTILALIFPAYEKDKNNKHTEKATERSPSLVKNILM